MNIDFGWEIPNGERRMPDGPENYKPHVCCVLDRIEGHFHSAWIPDHFMNRNRDDYPEALVTISHLAALYPQLYFGPIVLGQNYRNPALLAKMTATLQQLTGGRFILGVGAGWHAEEYKAYGYDFPPAPVRIAQLSEVVQICKAMWDPAQPEATFHGQYHHIAKAVCNPKPSPAPPVMIGGAGEKLMLRVIAQHADWWNLVGVSPETYAHKIEVLSLHCAEVGRDPSEIRNTWMGVVSIAPTRQQAETASPAARSDTNKPIYKKGNYSMNTKLFQKDFITTQDWTVEDLNTILELAFRLKGEFAMGVPHDHILRAKTLFMLFFEESTRTRNSFETGMTQLGGHAGFLTPKATQIGHGENARDTGIILSSYGHGIAIRDCRTGIGQNYLYEMAEHADAPIFSMQDDIDHPCQAMADLMTLMELFGRDLRGRKFVMSWTYAPKYVRPLSMPQSLVWLMPRFGMDVTLAYPEGYHLMPDVMEAARQNAEEAGVALTETHDMEAAFEDTDFLYPKSWGPIMVTEEEAEVEAMAAKNGSWRVTQAKMDLAKKQAIYMHCMPVDRGHEVDDEVIDGPQSVIYKQAENRLHIQKALMALTMGGRA